MAYELDYNSAPSKAIISQLCLRLDEIRLSQNVSQAELASRAGVSRRTLTRLADGQTISLDSFVRIIKALNLGHRLEHLVPDPSIRPVERVLNEGSERQRASKPRSDPAKWTWEDDST